MRQKKSDNFTAVLIHVKEGYLSPINITPKGTESKPETPSTYNPQKTKYLLKKISEYIEKVLKK